MRPTSLRPAAHLLLCGLLTQKVLPFTLVRLPLQIALFVSIFVLSSLLVVWPFTLFVYQPYFSPLRPIPSAPKELNHWKTWLAAEPTPPQLLQWANVVKKDPQFRGLMRYRGIGGGERILLCNPAALKEVLVAQQYSHFDRPIMGRKRIAVQAGTGLIASGGDAHKAQKRMLLPAFGSRAVRDLYPLFWSKAQELISALRVQIKNSETIDITSWTSRSALDIIGVAAWGRDFSAISQPESEFLRSYGSMFDLSGGGQLMNALALAIPMEYVLHIPCAYNRRLKEALHTIRTRCERTVRERNSLAQGGSGKDILSLLIRGGVQDEDALVNQMMTMLAAGHDTSSLALAWACYTLGQHKDVQERLRTEILSSQLPFRSGEDVENGDAQALNKLEYLQAVANEILRLYPAVPVTRREALQDTTVLGYFLPKDSHMVSSGWVVNRMEEDWGPDAGEFRPERWIEASSKPDSTDSFAYASFSHGARSCIGQGFAKAEFLVFLAALVGNFHIELQDPRKTVEAAYGITMSPVGGIAVQLRAVT